MTRVQGLGVGDWAWGAVFEKGLLFRVFID